MTHTIEKKDLSHLLDITDPFLMIDEFEVQDEGKTAKARKLIKNDEWFFDCHLPKERVMPATLQIEGMLQTLVSLIYLTYDHGEARAFITDINVKLLSSVFPTEDIIFEAELISHKRGITKGKVIGTCNSKTLCRGEFTYASPSLMPTPVSGALSVKEN
ncbi:MAG: hypothetical protein HWE30_01705 [Methylocystaceae bacterium]|nr:hypothetical protein [Methylocystaceae bacterium]